MAYISVDANAEKLARIKFRIDAPPRDISQSLGSRVGSQPMTTLVAGLSVDSDTLRGQTTVLLENVVLCRRAKSPAKYYTEYLKIGVPYPVWKKIYDTARVAGMTMSDSYKVSVYDNYAWLDVSIREGSSYFAFLEERGEPVKFIIDDVRGFFGAITTSLIAKIWCTMRLKKQFRAGSVETAEPWSLGLTPDDIYILGETLLGDHSPEQSVVEPDLRSLVADKAFCAVARSLLQIILLEDPVSTVEEAAGGTVGEGEAEVEADEEEEEGEPAEGGEEGAGEGAEEGPNQISLEPGSTVEEAAMGTVGEGEAEEEEDEEGKPAEGAEERSEEGPNQISLLVTVNCARHSCRCEPRSLVSGHVRKGASPPASVGQWAVGNREAKIVRQMSEANGKEQGRSIHIYF